MKRIVLTLVLATAIGGPLVGAGSDTEDAIDRFTQDQLIRNREAKPPVVDTRKVVKASNSFLHEREPELTPEEYALYQKIVTMLSTDPALAVKLLEAMMGGNNRPSPAFEFVLGNAYFEANQMPLAEKYYRGAVKDYPEFLRAWKNLGVLYNSTNRLGEAEKCFAKALALGDRDPSTLGLLGYSLEMQGDLVGAEVDYLQAVGLEPTNTDWQEGLLRVYIKGKQYGRAESLVRTLIKEKPADTGLWLDYAGILISENHKLEAMAVLETAQAAGAADPQALSLLGDLYAEQGLAPEAAATYAKLLGSDRSLGEKKLVYYAQVLIASGRLDEAAQTLAACKGEPTPAGRIELLRTRADLLMAEKRWPAARREVESLLKQSPLDGPALLALGRTYVEEKDLAHANFAFEQASRVPACAYRANLELANIAVQNRDYSKAVAYLQQALRLQQSDAVEDYLARIRALVPAEDKPG